MSAQHMPGPWHPIKECDQTGFRMTRHFVQCGGDILATVHAMGDSNDIDNTKLIAAAPDLLAALQDCADDLEAEIKAKYANTISTMYPTITRSHARDMATVVAARAAIAKATGGAA